MVMAQYIFQRFLLGRILGSSRMAEPPIRKGGGVFWVCLNVVQGAQIVLIFIHLWNMFRLRATCPGSSLNYCCKVHGMP